MFLFIAKWLIARNPAMTLAHAKKLAKIGVAVAAVVLLVVCFLVWDWWDDRQAVEAANLKREAAEARASLEGERRANTAGAKRDNARRADAETTEDQLEAIHDEDPETAAAPASRGSRAVADRLRR